jgi:CheY-like chemotaxis protein
MLDILFVDDDSYSMLTYVDALADEGFQVQQASSAKDVLDQVASREFAAVILDVMMPPGQLGERETAGGHRTGVALARRIRGEQPKLPILLLTNSDDATIYKWAKRKRAVVYLDKRHTRPDQLVRCVMRAVGVRGASPNVFLVHSQNHKVMSIVKDYLQKDLRLNEPTVLGHKPNDSRTVIEQFAHHGDDADVVIVLPPPDSLRRTANNTSMRTTRAVQGVAFELGYFLGAVGSRHGKVLLLNSGGQDVPPNIPGVACIDISHGIHAAGKDIRRELASWL